MRRHAMLLLMTCVWIIAQSQDNSEVIVKSGDKFFLGLNYSYLNADMRLLSLTNQSVWAGEDFGTLNVNQDEIDSLNSFVDYGEVIHEGIVSAGMVLLDKPDNPWFIDGSVTVGFGKRKHSVFNTLTDTIDMSFDSKVYSPSIGLAVNVWYRFNDTWRLGFRAHSHYLAGSSENVVDNIYPEFESLEESRKNTFDLSTSWFNLMAAYSLKDFTFSAGPGFYVLYNWNNYEIVRTNPADGKTYEDTIKTKLRNSNFFNGSIQIDWRFSDHFLLDAGAGFSNDITVTAGVFFIL